MPASAVKPVASSRENTSDQAAVSGDAESTAARVARVAPLNRLGSTGIPYGAPTLDLFADDAEQATLQAMNTDIRQGTLAGFELPDVFMAAVAATARTDDPLELVRMSRPLASAPTGVDLAVIASDMPSLDLFIDEPAQQACAEQRVPTAQAPLTSLFDTD